MTARYWLTPPELHAILDAEFGFDFDPCPYPRPEGYNSLILPWGVSNYVNPPFCRKDAPDGGPSAFVRKSITERDAGKTSVVILPVPNSIGLLLEAGAELRYGGKIRWLEADTKQPCPRAYRQVIAVLRALIPRFPSVEQKRRRPTIMPLLANTERTRRRSSHGRKIDSKFKRH